MFVDYSFDKFKYNDETLLQSWCIFKIFGLLLEMFIAIKDSLKTAKKKSATILNAKNYERYNK